jgi:small-conductance mechanosensitive channel
MLEQHQESRSMLSLAAIIIGGFVVYQLLFWIIRRWSRTQNRFFPRALEQHIYYPGLYLFVLIAAGISLPLLHSVLDSVTVHNIWVVVRIMIILASAILVIRILTVIKLVLLRFRHTENLNDFRARAFKTRFEILQQVLNFLIFTVAIILALMSFERVRELGTALIASAGVIGIILGFAAQKSLGTVFSGIQIALSQPIRIDDVVVVEDQFGTIGEIALTYVTVHTWDERRLIVPINYFIDKPFENWTRTSPEIIGKVKIYADYSIPVENVRQELFRILDELPQWDKRKRGLIVTDANQDGIVMRASMSAKNSDDAWDLEVTVRERLIEYIQKNFPDKFPRARILNMDRKNDE